MLARLRHCVGLVTLIVVVAAFSRGNAAPEDKLDANRDLIVFVGKKLSVVPQPAEEDSMDGKFEARFRILKRVFGEYDEPEITFTVYDHYGEPGFAKYATVLMFVRRFEGKLYHVKYTFVPVYHAANGRWAGCSDFYEWELGQPKLKLKATPIKFAGKVMDPD